jgi:hypothetical protein
MTHYTRINPREGFDSHPGHQLALKHSNYNRFRFQYQLVRQYRLKARHAPSHHAVTVESRVRIGAAISIGVSGGPNV